MTAPTTPTGSRVIVAIVPSGEGATWPYSLSMASACHRMQAAVSGMSRPTVSVIGLPASMVSMIPSSRPLASISVRPADQDPLAVARAQARPAPVVGRSPRRRDREVHVGRPALRDLGDRPSGRRVLGHEPPAALRIAEVAVDEQLRPEAEAVDLGPRLVDRGDQGVGHGGLSGWSAAVRGWGHSLANPPPGCARRIAVPAAHRRPERIRPIGRTVEERPRASGAARRWDQPGRSLPHASSSPTTRADRRRRRHPRPRRAGRRDHQRPADDGEHPQVGELFFYVPNEPDVGSPTAAPGSTARAR